MIRLYALLLIGLSFNFNFSSIPVQDKIDSVPINDGPYIFYDNGKLRARWIENSALKEDEIRPENFNKIKARFKLLPDYNDLISNVNVTPGYRQSYRKVDSIGVIADVHGEYPAFLRLLKAMGIIDSSLNWKFGAGHLVILGDIFDRGDQVTDSFWLLFRLEKQAEKMGGMVHFLLGNHELMVLGNDLSYVNKKYSRVAEISGTRYSDLYSENYILGRWLRSKPVMISINNILFTHAGVSMEMVYRNMNISRVNHTFSQNIVGKQRSETGNDEMLKFLNGSKGPVWYRGYFNDEMLTNEKVDSILNYYQKRHIVIGHTSCEAITLMFNNKIIAVDAGLGIGQPGAMLIFKDGQFYQGTCSGGRIKL